MAAYLLVWNPKYDDWNDGFLDEKLALITKGKSVEMRWRTGKSLKPQEGDLAFCIKTGSKGRGIFASGKLTQNAKMAGQDCRTKVIWEELLDPRDKANLLDMTQVTKLKAQNWTPQASCISIKPEVVAPLTKLWQAHLQKIKKLPTKTDVEAELDDLSGEERKIIQETAKRIKRDRKLRAQVVALWGTSCCACGLSLEADGRWECEVAHVWEVHAKGKDSISNALPLCRTHHWAFDQRLFAIEPKTFKILVAPSHQNGFLKDIHDKKLKPSTALSSLEPSYLQARLDDCQKRWK